MITFRTAADIRSRITTLEAERDAADREGLLDPVYRADLESELGATRAAYVGAAVTEIATLRAALSGPLQG